MKTCQTCSKDEPEVEFGAGASNYCKECRCIDRKRRIKEQSMLPEQKVRRAIQEGCRTREEIKRRTKLTFSEVGDVLADLMDREGLVLRKVA